MAQPNQYNHFTGKKKSNGPKKRKRSERSKKIHVNKYKQTG